MKTREKLCVALVVILQVCYVYPSLTAPSAPVELPIAKRIRVPESQDEPVAAVGVGVSVVNTNSNATLSHFAAVSSDDSLVKDHADQQHLLPARWLGRGVELFYDNETESGSAFASCRRLDDLNQVQQLQARHSPALFVNCMRDLEVAQKAFRESFPDFSEQCAQPHSLIHTMWQGPVHAAARLGILSFVLAHPPGCVHVRVYTVDNVTRAALHGEFAKLINKQLLSVVPLDFNDMCTRIVQLHPSLDTLLSLIQPQLVHATERMGRTGSAGSPVQFSDLVRMFVLSAYGGVYLDCDMLLLRPLTPLLHSDFVYRWSFAAHFNTAAMHLKLGSPNALVLLQYGLNAARGSAKKLIHLYFPQYIHLLFHRLNITHTIRVLPSAFFDPLWIVMDAYGEGSPVALDRFGVAHVRMFFQARNAVPSIQEDVMANFFPGAFTFHWHNQWGVDILRKSTAYWFNVAYNILLDTL